MRALFTGYAPVHFVCFRPLFDRLRACPDMQVFVSGGLRTATDDGYDYDLDALYDPFDVPAENRLPVETIAEQDFDVLFGANTKLITPRSVDTRIQIFHGISFRNKAVRPDNMSCDHYFVVGPYMRRRFEDAGLFHEDDPRAVSIGFMKTDRLRDGSLDQDAVRTSFGFDGSRPVLLYAPTGQKHNSLETMGEAVIERLLETQRYHLLIKLHDHPKRGDINWRERLQPLLGDHGRVVNDFDIAPAMVASDLLISDASSVSNEYALLDRPMVFLDVPRLIERARRAESSMVDLDTWGRRGGATCPGPDEIADLVEDALDHPHQHADVRHDMVADLFYNPGAATQAATSWMERTLGLSSRANASVGV